MMMRACVCGCMCVWVGVYVCVCVCTYMNVDGGRGYRASDTYL